MWCRRRRFCAIWGRLQGQRCRSAAEEAAESTEVRAQACRPGERRPLAKVAAASARVAAAQRGPQGRQRAGTRCVPRVLATSQSASCQAKPSQAPPQVEHAVLQPQLLARGLSAVLCLADKEGQLAGDGIHHLQQWAGRQAAGRVEPRTCAAISRRSESLGTAHLRACRRSQ